MTVHRTVGVYAAFLLAISATGSSANGQQLDGTELLRKMLASYEERESQLNSVHITYETENLTTKTAMALSKAKQPKDIRHTESVVYARKGDKYFMRSVGDNPLVAENNRDRFLLDTGEVMLSTSMLPNTVSLTRQRQAIFLCELPLHIVGEQYLLTGLRQWSNKKIDLGRVTVKTLKDDLTQRELYEIETHPKPPITRFQCVVQPDAGYVIRKLMTFNRNGGRIDTFQCDDYETVNGFPFPKSGLHEHYLISNQLAFSVKYRLKSFTLNSSEVSDRLFERDIPKGTLVWDEDNHVHVPYTVRVQTHVDEAIQNVGTKTGLWRSWYLWTGVLLATLGAGSYLIRRRWREKRQLSSAHS